MLVDPFGRHINYLRDSVTDRCNMRCSYCMPVGFRGYEVPSHWLTLEESARLIRIFASLGDTKVRITGGEPLLGEDIVEFAEAYAENSGLEDISLSTNRSMLTRIAVPLRRAWVRRVNVSLDTMNPAKSAQITSRDVLPSVLSGLGAAKDAGFDQIKLNAVVQADVSDDEIEALLSYAIENGFILRLIEPMPMGHTGQRTSAANLTAVGARLAAKYSLLSTVGGDGGGPARYWSTSAGQIRLDVITPMSQHFCEACNRVRLTVDGRLLLCLGHEDAVHLGRHMREGFSDAELLEVIAKPFK